MARRTGTGYVRDGATWDFFRPRPGPVRTRSGNHSKGRWNLEPHPCGLSEREMGEMELTVAPPGTRYSYCQKTNLPSVTIL